MAVPNLKKNYGISLKLPGKERVSSNIPPTGQFPVEVSFTLNAEEMATLKELGLVESIRPVQIIADIQEYALPKEIQEAIRLLRSSGMYVQVETRQKKKGGTE